MSQLKLRHPDLQADSLHFDTLEVHAGEPRDAYGARLTRRSTRPRRSILTPPTTR